MQSTEELLQLFRQKGMKVTPQRRVIIDLMQRVCWTGFPGLIS